MASADLQIAIRAVDQASATLKNVANDLKGLGTSAQSSGPGFLSLSTAMAAGTVAAHGLMAAAQGLAQIFVSAISAAAGFDESIASIRSKLSTAEWDQYGAALQQTAMRLGRDYPLSAAEAGKAIDLLVQKGVSAKNINEGWAESVVLLSSATGSDLVTAAGIAAAASDAFGISAEQSRATVNGVTAAVLKGGMSIEDYGYGMKAAAGVVALAGGTIDDLNLALAVMARRGVEGADGGTSIKTMYMGLIPTTKEATKVARELGIITADGSNRFFDASGKVKDYVGISKVLAEATKGLTEQQKLMALETLFGSDAIRAAAFAADFGRGEIDELAASMKGVDAGDVTAKRMDNLKGSFDQLTGSLETAGIAIGLKFTPGLKTIVDGATEVVNNAMPLLEGFAEDASAAITEASTQIADAWRTAKQAFAGQWLPSDQIPPFVNAVGQAATALGELAGWLQQVSDRAGQLGVWDGLREVLDTLGAEWESLTGNLSGFGDALGILHEALGGTAGEADILGEVLLGLVQTVKTAVLIGATFVDALISIGRAAIDVVSMIVSVGRALHAIANGDLPAAEEALRSGDKAFLDLIATGEGFASRSAERLRQAFTTVRKSAEDELPAVAAVFSTELGNAEATTSTTAGLITDIIAASMADSAAAAETGMGAVATATEAGMTQAVGAVEAAGPQAVVAAESMGSGMATAIEGAAPAMAVAAEAGASSVVAAVEAGAPAASAAASAMGSGMAAGVESAAPAMEAAASSAASGAVGAVQAQQGAASAAGAGVGDALGAGMQGGILGWVGSIASAAASLVSAAIGAANAAAQVESPSKKTRKTGEMLGKGYLEGLESVAPAVREKLRHYLDAAADYTPVAGEILRVEREIKDVRERAQTDALFRAKDMIDVESEMLRIKKDQITAERDLLPAKQALAAVTREVSDLERGSLPERQQLIEMDGQRKALRLQTLDLEKQLVGLDRDSKRAKSIQEQIDKLNDQDRLLSIETERIRLTNDVAATGARVRKEGLEENVQAQQRVIDAMKDQLDVLAAEEGVFRANEAVIKNATDNEVAYRERLIAVFKSEGKPLLDRIQAGLQLVDQLEAEGKISKELADQLRKVGKEATDGKGAVSGLGAAAGTAAPQIDQAAKKAAEMAEQARKIAQDTNKAEDEVKDLGNTIKNFPSLFKLDFDFDFGKKKAAGGPVLAGSSYLVGELGPELFVPGTSGMILPNGLTSALLAGDALRAAGSAPAARGGDTFNFYGVTPETMLDEAERQSRKRAYLRGVRRQ